MFVVAASLLCFLAGAFWWHQSRDQRLSSLLVDQGRELQRTQDRLAEHDRQFTDTRATVQAEQRLNAEQGLEIGKLRERMTTVESDLTRTAAEIAAARARLDRADGRIQALESLRLDIERLVKEHEAASQERDNLRLRLETLERETLDSEVRLRRIEEHLGLTPRPME